MFKKKKNSSELTGKSTLDFKSDKIYIGANPYTHTHTHTHTHLHIYTYIYIPLLCDSGAGTLHTTFIICCPSVKILVNGVLKRVIMKKEIKRIPFLL